MIDSTELEVSDRSQVSSVRRAASDILRQRGFGENDLASAELIVTELATNLVKHAQHGAIIVTAAEGTAPFADIVAIDCGPGIRDVNSALRDGYSTAGSPGTGLGAVQRRASLFDVYSRAEQGTIVYARLVRDAEVGRRPARRLI